MAPAKHVTIRTPRTPPHAGQPVRKTSMAKKRNLKREKAERNREYAKQFQKSRARNSRRFRSVPRDQEASAGEEQQP